MTQKGVVICRVSSQGQMRKGASLESQEEWAMSKTAEMKVEIVKKIKKVISGEIFPRKYSKSILNLVDKEGITHLFVYSFDRLSRSLPFGAMLVHKLWEKKVQIVTSTIIPDLSNPNDRFYVWLSLAFAEMEQGQRLERTTRGMITKLKRGEYPLPHLPFGYERVDCKLHLIPEYKPVIEFLFKTFCKAKNYAETARRVTDKYGRRMGFKLKAYDVKKIVTNQMYIGYIEWGGEIFGG